MTNRSVVIGGTTPATWPEPLRGLAERCADWVGEMSQVIEVPGSDAQVWRVDGSRGRCWVKKPRPGRSYGQERDAWRRLAPLLKQRLPELLLADEAHGLLVTRDAGGRAGDEVGPNDPCSEPAARALGAIAAAMRTCAPVIGDPMPIHEAMRRRADGWIRRAKKANLALAADDIDALSRRINRCRTIADSQCDGAPERSLCHRDLAPRNWRVGPAGDVVLVDLGHARDDLWLVDLVKLWDGPWAGQHRLWAAFFDGLGAPLTPNETIHFEALCALHSLGTWVWGVGHGDAVFATQGAALMKALRGGFAPSGAQSLGT